MLIAVVAALAGLLAPLRGRAAVIADYKGELRDPVAEAFRRVSKTARLTAGRNPCCGSRAATS
jgi:hypothetical protein